MKRPFGKGINPNYGTFYPWLSVTYYMGWASKYCGQLWKNMWVENLYLLPASRAQWGLNGAHFICQFCGLILASKWCKQFVEDRWAARNNFLLIREKQHPLVTKMKRWIFECKRWGMSFFTDIDAFVEYLSLSTLNISFAKSFEPHLCVFF